MGVTETGADDNGSLGNERLTSRDYRDSDECLQDQSETAQERHRSLAPTFFPQSPIPFKVVNPLVL